MILKFLGSVKKKKAFVLWSLQLLKKKQKNPTKQKPAGEKGNSSVGFLNTNGLRPMRTGEKKINADNFNEPDSPDQSHAPFFLMMMMYKTTLLPSRTHPPPLPHTHTRYRATTKINCYRNKRRQHVLSSSGRHDPKHTRTKSSDRTRYQKRYQKKREQSYHSVVKS